MKIIKNNMLKLENFGMKRIKMNYPKNVKFIEKAIKKIFRKEEKNITKNNKEEISEKHKKYNNQLCFDPTNGTKCTLGALMGRKCRNKEKYKDVNPKNCIIKDN